MQDTLESPTVILAEREQRLQDRQVLLTRAEKCEGVCNGLQRASEIAYNRNLPADFLMELSNALVAAHQEWKAANQAWSETL